MLTRCFIAINLPTDLKKEISFLIEELKEKNPSHLIKWVKPENIHLTLHFLGNLDKEKIITVQKIIQEKINNFKSTELELKNVDGFPNLNYPKVLFIAGQEIDDGQPLKKLQMEIGKDLEQNELEIDHRPWRMHFTLARFKEPLPLLLDNLKELGAKFFEIKSIELMKSELTPGGPKYSILRSFGLKSS